MRGWICRISALVVLWASMLTAQGYTFQEKSRFESGRWVKVEIAEKGLHTITYDQLREMGFTDPSKVSVYGRGGELFSMSFTGTENGVAYTDCLPEVSAIRTESALTFYAVGTDNVTYRPLAISGAPGFVRNPRNIYSDSSWYFLTDSNETPAEMETTQTGDAVAELSDGMWYAYHELDLEQNTTGTGHLFWGEDLMKEDGRRVWDVATPLRVEGDGYMETAWYLSPSAQAKITYSPGGEDTPVINLSTTSSKLFVPKIDRRIYSFGRGERLTVRMDVELMNAKFMHLDYWVFSYRKRFPVDIDEVRGREADYMVATGVPGLAGVRSVVGMELLDVTDPQNPVRSVPMQGESGDCLAIYSDGTPRHIVAYDPECRYRGVKSWHKVENRDLRMLAADSPDMIVVSVPRFRDYARQIAALHGKYDGQKVVVVTPEEVYNEFSGGVPDAMAYRAMVKYVYEKGGGRLKNLLLFGPGDKNLRQEVRGESCWDRIIAFHEPDASGDREASVVYDFYGILSDIVTPSLLNREKMSVGVGVLPCETEEECTRMVTKIGEFLQDKDWAWRTNSAMVTGGVGDNHTHEFQAVEFGDYISSNMPDRPAVTTLCIDAYGYPRAHQEFLRRLNEGQGMNVYFGHGSSRMIGKTLDFFHVGDALGMQNQHLGFMFMGGCDFTRPDQRKRGLGEAMVVSSDRCMIATVISTRTTWSNQNFDFGQRLVRAMQSAGDADATPTLGEVYAAAKSGSDYANSTCYILVGDPALRLPMARRRIEMGWELTDHGIVPGARMNVSGRVLDKSGATDAGYNGKAVLKFMQPSVTLRSADYVSGAGANKDHLDVTYRTVPEFAVEIPVKEGVISGEIMIPVSVERFKNSALPLYVGAYDADKHLGAAGYMEVEVRDTAGIADDALDHTAPELEVEYLSSSRMLALRSHDDLALPAKSGGLVVRIGGREYEVSPDEAVDNGAETREFSGFVDLSGLSSGEYEAEVECRDVAGNEVLTAIVFTVSEDMAPLGIELDGKAVVGRLTGRVLSNEGAECAENLTFEVVGSDGRKVGEGTVRTGNIEWECRDAEGGDVPAGLYRIMVRGVDAKGRSLYSGWVKFAVLD